MRTTRWLGWRGTVVAGLLLLAGLLQACTSNDTNSGPSFPSTIAGSGNPAALILRASTAAVACDGTVTITALVVTSTGQPIAGVTIIFTADKGAVSPTSATTNAGEATTTFTATSSLLPATCGAGVASGMKEDAKITAEAVGTGTKTDTITVTVIKP